MLSGPLCILGNNVHSCNWCVILTCTCSHVQVYMYTQVHVPVHVHSCNWYSILRCIYMYINLVSRLKDSLRYSRVASALPPIVEPYIPQAVIQSSISIPIQCSITNYMYNGAVCLSFTNSNEMLPAKTNYYRQSDTQSSFTATSQAYLNKQHHSPYCILTANMWSYKYLW